MALKNTGAYGKILRGSNQVDYETPKNALELIIPFIPDGARIWDPFYCNGMVSTFWKELGYDIKHEPGVDFFTYKEYPEDVDIIIANPPYDIFSKIVEVLVKWDKPFAVFIPCNKLGCKYLEGLNHTQFIFVGGARFYVDGKQYKDSCPIKFCWLCYKMNLPQNYFKFLK